ncbi:MAG: hypothetical protein ACM3O9_06820 [Methylocystaceae bacterium]
MTSTCQQKPGWLQNQSPWLPLLLPVAALFLFSVNRKSSVRCK